MKFEGNLRKMRTRISNSADIGEVDYTLSLNGDSLAMNQYIGKKVKISYLKQINCIYCGRKTARSFAQGYCYPCFITRPETDSCILKPETCQAHLGISRDQAWSEQHCLSDHIVYLALTPGLKVGVTRSSQVPTRWIDQGALEAIPLALTTNRYNAGIIEVFLKSHLSDKTNWRQMLTGAESGGIDLRLEKIRITALLTDQFRKFVSDDADPVSIRYPVLSYSDRVTPVNFDTTPVVEGVMTGIKGQYLLFGDGKVLNIRKFGGYLINMEI